jgi:hypothetical protein
MSGVVFYKTRTLKTLKDFYTTQLGCGIWLEQSDCIIFSHGNMLFGFCQRDEADLGGLTTFFYETRKEVDQFYGKFKETAESAPVMNDKYDIYHFFTRDPEGRRLEFQFFNHDVAEFRTGAEILSTRRSIRKFRDVDISDELYYFKIIRDKEILNRLSEVRGSSSEPIGNAPLAVAICSNPNITKRHTQDGCVAAYHFILAAWYYSLGTCWIAAMNRDDVKEMLAIPNEHYIATITPLGYPENWPVKIPERKELDWFLRD